MAPHSLLSSTQLAIKKHDEKKRVEQFEYFERLERIYLATPYNDLHEPGIRVSAGEADIVIPIDDKLNDPAGIPSSVVFKAMNDSATFAVNSLVDSHYVLPASFRVSLTGTIPRGEIIARGRFVGMSGKKYLAESMLTDADGKEIGRGEGTFIVSNIALDAPENAD